MPENLTVQGHIITNEITGNAGDQNAVASITVPVEVGTLEEVFTLSAVAVAAAVGIGGLRCTGRPFSQDDDGRFRVSFTFEGFNQEVSEETALESVELNFQTSMDGAPIQSHPKFDRLQDKYGWDEANERFPKWKLGVTEESTTGLSRGQKKQLLNPALGTDEWKRVGGVFTRSYSVSVVSPRVYLNVGTCIDYPPDAQKLNIPRFKDRKWLVLSPQVTPRGSAYNIVESYQLGGPGGAELMRDIYSFGQLGSGGGREQGLHTGTIGGSGPNL